jgi:hypothetical protein
MNENFWMAPAGYAACNFLDIFVAPHNCISEKSTSPPTYEGWNTSPPNLWKWIFYPLNFLKQGKSPTEAVLKKS